MKRRNFFKYILGCLGLGVLPLISGKTVEAAGISPEFPKDDKLYVVIQGHYNGKAWAGHVVFDETIMTFDKVKSITTDMGGSMARCLSKNRIITPYRDYT